MRDIDSELLQRVTRIETRIMSLGDRLGYNLKDKEVVKATCNAPARKVYISAYDVSLSTIINCARTAGVADEWVDIVIGDERLGEVWVGGNI